MTWTTLPYTCPSSLIAVTPLLLEGLRTAEDLGDLLGDRSLPGPVVSPGQIGDHVLRIVGGGLHRDPPGHLLRSDGFCQNRVHELPAVKRKKAVEDLLGGGLEQRLHPCRPRNPLRRDGEEPEHRRRLAGPALPAGGDAGT